MAAPGNRDDRPAQFSGEQARQGRIVLTTRRRRVVFFGALVALVLFPLVTVLIWN